MKKPQFDLLILLVATALVTAFMLDLIHRHEINLYKARLGETLDRIHLLEEQLEEHSEIPGHADHDDSDASDQAQNDPQDLGAPVNTP